jgi:hypothetical protein
MEKEIKAKAQGIFKEYPAFDKLFVNPNGEFFTSKNLAENSVKVKSEITEILKKDVIKDSTQNGDQLPKLKAVLDKAQTAFDSAKKVLEENQGDAKSEKAFATAEANLKAAQEAYEKAQEK